MDYCKAALADVPSPSLAPLQDVLHAAVRLVTRLGSRDHWNADGNTLAADRCVIRHAAVSGQCPAYIREVVDAVIITRWAEQSRGSSL